jgi:hypothetical protein
MTGASVCLLSNRVHGPNHLKWPGLLGVRDIAVHGRSGAFLLQLSRNKDYNAKLMVAGHSVSIRGRKILSQRTCD